MDFIAEKSTTLSKTGSFYYRSMSGTHKSEAEFMSHLPWQTKLFNQCQNSTDLTLSGGHFRGMFKNIKFSDLNVGYGGLKHALQERVRGYIKSEAVVEKPLRPENESELWDYTPGDSIMVAAWSEADLSEDVIIPGGVLRGIKIDLPEGASVPSTYMSILQKTDTGYHYLATSGVAQEKDNSAYWAFADTPVHDSAIKLVLTSERIEESQPGDAALISIVDHLDNNSQLTNGDSINIGVVPQAIFFLRDASIPDILVLGRPANLTIKNSFGILTEYGDIISEEDDVIIFNGGDEDIILPESTEVTFTLTIDPNIYVTSIQTNGKRLLAGVDFTSEFGKLTFAVNPIQMFPDMQCFAYSFIQRRRNLYCYPLRLDDVYGPVDRVMHYYRASQSPRAFYLAAAQAAGLAVVREDCKVIKSLPLFEGRLYITDKGNYEVPYKHTPIPLTTELTGGTVIGGEELFTLVTPGNPLPNAVTSISMDGILPVKGLEAPNSIIPLYNAKGVYNPAYTGPQEALQAYEEYVKTYAEQRGEDAPSAWKNYTPEDATNINESITSGFQELNYVHGEYSWEIKVRIDTYSSDFFSTRCMIDIAPDYHFISQAGQYLGLSADSTSMRDDSGIAFAAETEVDATGEFISWPVPTTTENNINTWITSSKLYGWISRTGTGAQGVSDAITIPGALIVLRYDMLTDTFSFEVGNTEQDNPVTEVVKITGFNPDPTYMRVKVEASHGLTGTLLALRIMKPTEENAITHVRNTVCPNILLIACINYSSIQEAMLMRLQTFMNREKPFGSVLTTADLPITISEEETVHV